MTNSFELEIMDAAGIAELAFLQECQAEVNQMPEGAERDEAKQALAELYPVTAADEAEVSGFMTMLDSNELDRQTGYRNLDVVESLLPPKPIVEIVPEEIPDSAENLLASRGVLAVVRAANYEDFYADIVPQLKDAGLHMVKAELFPEAHSSITGGSTLIHLDNFAEDDAPDYRYDLSASRVDKGRVIFIGGQATAHARDARRKEHLRDRRELRRDEKILELEREALKNKAPASAIEFTARDAKGERLHAIRGKLVAVALAQGDVALWAQGGPGSEMPVWHAVQQIGNSDHPAFQARSSTSVHFVKR